MYIPLLECIIIHFYLLLITTCLCVPGTLIDGEPIINLPPKRIHLTKVDFSPEERAFYAKLESDSRSQFKVLLSFLVTYLLFIWFCFIFPSLCFIFFLRELENACAGCKVRIKLYSVRQFALSF